MLRLESVSVKPCLVDGVRNVVSGREPAVRRAYAEAIRARRVIHSLPCLTFRHHNSIVVV